MPNQVVNDQAALLGNFKEIYAKKLEALYLFMAPLCAEYFPFEAADAIGNKFHQPVDLQMEQGFTHSAGGVTPSVSGVGGWLPPVAGQSQDAQVVGGQIFGRAQVAYEAIYRSKDNKRAFEEATGWVVKRLATSHLKRMEIFALHGGRGLGTIDSTNAAANGLTRAYTITTATSSPGIWNGLLNARVVFWKNDYSALDSLAGNGTIYAYVSAISINASTSQVTLTLTYNTSSGNTDLTTNFSNDQIFFETAGPGSEPNGLDQWSSLTNTSATFANIAPASYELWQANQYAVSGPMKFRNVLETCAVVSSYGILSGPLCVVVHPLTFAGLMTEQAALRRYAAERVKAEFQNGAEKLVFSTGVAEVEVLSHPMQKMGLAHLFCHNEGKRIGSTDMTFITRGEGKERLILESATGPASEMRTYSLTEHFFEQPRHLVQLTGITN